MLEIAERKVPDVTVGGYHYLVSIRNQGGDAVYELSLDIYPEQDPRHPQRHYGHWNKMVSLKAGQTVDLDVFWQPLPRQVWFDGEPPDMFWQGELREYGPCVVSLVLYRDHQRVAFRLFTQQIDPAGAEAEPKRILLEVGTESQLKSAVWFLTWACNFRCPYCWEVQRIAKGEMKPEPFIAGEKWAAAWNRIRPRILDITGGEPFLQPGFIQMLHDLDDSIRVAITTNLSRDVTEFVQKISPEKVFSMTVSYHPTQPMPLLDFLGKALLLKNRGFNLTVNFVTYPEQMWMLADYKQTFEARGLRFHVDPYASTPYYPFTYSNKEQEYIRKFVGQDRSHCVANNKEVQVFCSGGFEHLNVQPNGDAFRCIHDKIENLEKIGNLFSPDFQLLPEWKFCGSYHVCPNCDRDKVRVKNAGQETVN